MVVKALAPAKINLSLDVGGLREDKYHEVNMIMQAINLFDIVTIDTTNTGKIIINSSNKRLPTNEKNSAYIAANIFFDTLNVKNNGININIVKKIPVTAGLAGGSTDAAAVLVALNHLYKTNLNNDELADLGAKVGSDVPFCIYGGTMLALGRGTNLKKLSPMPDCYIVLVKPVKSVLTKKAYQLIDEGNIINRPDNNKIIGYLDSNNLTGVASEMKNVFEDVVSISDISTIKHLMKKHNPLGICMSGSGPTVFCVFKDENKAANCEEELKKSFSYVYRAKPINYGCFIKKI